METDAAARSRMIFEYEMRVARDPEKDQSHRSLYEYTPPTH